MTQENAHLLIESVGVPLVALFVWLTKRVFDKLLASTDQQNEQLAAISEKMTLRLELLGSRVAALEQRDAVQDERIMRLREDVSGLGRRLNEHQRGCP